MIDSLGLAGCIFFPEGEPDLEPTDNTRVDITEEWTDRTCFPIPAGGPGRPSISDTKIKPSSLLPSIGMTCQNNYYAEGIIERQYNRGYWGILRCYDDCGKLTDETFGFKNVDTVWQYDDDYFWSGSGPITDILPSGPGIGPDDLPPLGRRR